MAFRGDSTDTYTYVSGSTGGTVDLGARNNYRYVNASNVYNKGKSDGVTTHTGTYTFPANDTGGTKDLGVNHTYRYVNATNVYNKGKADAPQSAIAAFCRTGGGFILFDYTIDNKATWGYGYSSFSHSWITITQRYAAAGGIEFVFKPNRNIRVTYVMNINSDYNITTGPSTQTNITRNEYVAANTEKSFRFDTQNNLYSHMIVIYLA